MFGNLKLRHSAVAENAEDSNWFTEFAAAVATTKTEKLLKKRHKPDYSVTFRGGVILLYFLKAAFKSSFVHERKSKNV